MDHDTHGTPAAEPSPGGAGAATAMADEQQQHEHEHETPPAPRRLRRGPGGPFAGVCEGIGWYFAIDPTVVRIAFVVAAALGGIGLVAYGAAWLLVPRYDDPNPDAIRVERGVRRVGGLVLGLVVIAIVAAVVGAPLDLDGPGVLLAFALVAAGVYLLTRQPAGVPATVPPGPSESAMPAPPRRGAPTVVAPMSAEPRRPRSPLGPIVLGAITAGAGVMLALDLADVVDPVTRDYATLGLVLSGLGLVASAFFGRALILIPVGVAFAVLLGAAVWAPDLWDDGMGDRRYEPVTLAELRPAYELGAGELELDLRALDLAGATRTVKAKVGVGALLVRVPPDVDVEVQGEASLGNVQVLGRETDGWQEDPLVVEEDLEGASRLVIDASVSLGDVEVRRG